jgi:hypothetical protein
VCGGTLVIADKRSAQCLNCEERFPLEEVTVEEGAELRPAESEPASAKAA